MNLKRIAIYLIIYVGVLAGFGIFLDKGSFTSFAINDFVDAGDLQQGDRIIVDVKCFIKSITFFENAQGVVVDQSDASSFLKENPRFDFTATTLQTNKNILFVHPVLFMKCQMPTLTDDNGDTIFPLIIEKGSSVEYRVVSQSGEAQEKKVTYIKDDKIVKDLELVHDTEILIYEDVFSVDEIVQRLDDGSYNSFQQVDWTGYLQMHLKDPDNPSRFAGIKWFIDFTEGSNSNNVDPINPLTTWLEIQINKDSNSQTGGTGGDSTPPTFPKPDVCNENCSPANEPDNIFVEFVDCLGTGDPNCYLNEKFIGVFGLIGAFGVGAIVVNNVTKKGESR